jgi:alpha-tubulin suppressor-like RCC1 family protein
VYNITAEDDPVCVPHPSHHRDINLPADPFSADPFDPFNEFLAKADLDSVLPLADGERFSAVSAGFHHTSALTSHNRLLCWGKYGDQFFHGRLVLHADELFKGISAGLEHTSVVTTHGRVLTWDGNGKKISSGAPELPWGEQYVAVSQGFDRGLALTSQGELVAWGNDEVSCNGAPQLDEGESYVMMSIKFAEVPHGVISNGHARSWSFVGDEEMIDRAPPEDDKFVTVSCGFRHTAALTKAGRLICWGDDSYGQISHVPVLQAGEIYVSVSAGASHTVAITSCGRLLAWGLDNLGQCSAVPYLSPREEFKQASAGGFHTTAVTSKGRLLAWGSDKFDQCSRVPSLWSPCAKSTILDL